MKTSTPHMAKPGPDPGRIAAVADALCAAETAARSAAAACEWARHAGVGEDDAADAARASQRARKAAERAECSTSADQAWDDAAAAWAAATSAAEADARVVAAIAALMVAA